VTQYADIEWHKLGIFSCGGRWYWNVPESVPPETSDAGGEVVSDLDGSVLERDFILACMALDLPAPEREYRFDQKRKWRADFAWPFQRVLVEIEGGEWAHGRHVTPRGYNKDCEKYNFATINRWRLLRFTGTMIRQDPVGCAQLVKTLLTDTE
jgi:hypothetical protein